jgi:hypothetical protein
MPHRKDHDVGSLHEVTYDLLRASEETAFTVAEETGLTYSWIVAFAGNRMRNPSVSKVQRLYEYLAGKPLLAR